MTEIGSGEFLASKYQDMSASIGVKRAMDIKRDEGIKVLNNPENRINVYLERLEKIFDNPDLAKREKATGIFKEKYIYPSVLNEGQKNYNDQKESLDVWIDYLTSQEAADYPTWFKYLTLRSVVKMGNYNPETGDYSRRTKSNTGLFAELDPAILAQTYDVLKNNYLKGEEHDQEELNRILEKADFSKIYGYFNKNKPKISEDDQQRKDGEWTKFNKGDEPTALCESLKGKQTGGWCTVGTEKARFQLKEGDFYVYYTKDENGKNTIPRIAIRMEKGQVVEVRGIEGGQGLEDTMIDIAKEKYSQLPGGEKYIKRDHDTKYLISLNKKIKNKEELSKKDLRFIYEFDGDIEGFGGGRDPRISEIIKTRDVVSDFKLISEENNICFGSLDFWIDDGFPSSVVFGKYAYPNSLFLRDLALPKEIIGDFEISRITTIDGLVLSEIVRKNVSFPSLESAKGMVFPKIAGSDVSLHSLDSIEDSSFPELIGNNFYIRSLRKIDNTNQPKEIGGDFYFYSMESIANWNLSKLKVGGVCEPFITPSLKEQKKIKKAYPNLKFNFSSELGFDF